MALAMKATPKGSTTAAASTVRLYSAVPKIIEELDATQRFSELVDRLAARLAPFDLGPLEAELKPYSARPPLWLGEDFAPVSVARASAAADYTGAFFELLSSPPLLLGLEERDIPEHGPPQLGSAGLEAESLERVPCGDVHLRGRADSDFIDAFEPVATTAAPSCSTPAQAESPSLSPARSAELPELRCCALAEEEFLIPAAAETVSLPETPAHSASTESASIIIITAEFAPVCDRDEETCPKKADDGEDLLADVPFFIDDASAEFSPAEKLEPKEVASPPATGKQNIRVGLLEEFADAEFSASTSGVQFVPLPVIEDSPISVDLLFPDMCSLQPESLVSIEIHLRPFWNTDRMYALKESLGVPVPDFFPRTSSSSASSLVLSALTEGVPSGVLEAAEDETEDLGKPGIHLCSKDLQRTAPLTARTVRESVEDFMRSLGKTPEDSHHGCLETAAERLAGVQITVPALFCDFMTLHVELAKAAAAHNSAVFLPQDVPLLPVAAFLIHTFFKACPDSAVLWIFDGDCIPLSFKFFSALLSRIGHQSPSLFDPSEHSLLSAEQVLFISARDAEAQLFSDKSLLSRTGLAFFELDSLENAEASLQTGRALLSSFSPRIVLLPSFGPDAFPASRLLDTFSALGIEQLLCRKTTDADVLEEWAPGHEACIVPLDPNMSELLASVLAMGGSSVSGDVAAVLLSHGVNAAHQFLSATAAESQGTHPPGMTWLLSKLEQAVQEVDAGLFSGAPPEALFVAKMISEEKQSDGHVLVVAAQPSLADSLAETIEWASDGLVSVMPRSESRELPEETEADQLRIARFDSVALSVEELAWNLSWANFSAVVVCSSVSDSSSSALRECPFLFHVPRVTRLHLSSSCAWSCAQIEPSSDRWVQSLRACCGSPRFDAPIPVSLFQQALETSSIDRAAAYALVPAAACSTRETNTSPAVVVIGSSRFFDGPNSLVRTLEENQIVVVRRTSFEPELRILAVDASTCCLLWSDSEERASPLVDTLRRLLSGPFLSAIVVIECRLPLSSRASVGFARIAAAHGKSVSLRFSSSPSTSATIVGAICRDSQQGGALLDEEDVHETFLLRLGVNPFAAQLLLGSVSLHELLFSESTEALLEKLATLDAGVPAKLVERLMATITAEAPQKPIPPKPATSSMERGSFQTPVVPPSTKRSSLDERLDQLERESLFSRELSSPAAKKSKPTLHFELPWGSARGQSVLTWPGAPPPPPATTPKKTPSKRRQRQAPSAGKEILLKRLEEYFGCAQTPEEAAEYRAFTAPRTPAKRQQQKKHPQSAHML